eukprot:TRINITY_DN90396_c0_g1_i1.p1 TRINITY_DN90396_c0_g1~~TRINITY_DN90396_c0_g1_i1.p1  ORF type:complete len:402 (+),score=66.74 TRINITY_DN90396_c0_g1_i1:80-1285(+)
MLLLAAAGHGKLLLQASGGFGVLRPSIDLGCSSAACSATPRFMPAARRCVHGGTIRHKDCSSAAVPAEAEFDAFLSTFCESLLQEVCQRRPVRVVSANGRTVALHWASDLAESAAEDMTAVWQGRLVHVWPDLWISRTLLLQSMLLAIFGMRQKRVFARDLRARRLLGLERSVGEKFIAEHHLLRSRNGRSIVGKGFRMHVLEKPVCGLLDGAAYASTLDAPMQAAALFGPLHRWRPPGSEEPRLRTSEMLRFCTTAGMQVLGGLSKLTEHFCRQQPQAELLRTEVARDMSDAASYRRCGWTVQRIISANHYPPMWIRGGASFYERELLPEVLGAAAAEDILAEATERPRQYQHPLAIGNQHPKDVQRREALEAHGYQARVGCGAFLLTLRVNRDATEAVA